jgi:hypothetical protein
MKAPVRARDTLQLMALYDPYGGVESLADRVSWAGVSPRQIYHAILGRLPENGAVAVAPPGYSPRAHAAEALASPEFQQAIIRRVLHAYPEKERLLFVHVPRCAGTDLIENLSERYPALHADQADPAITPPERLFEHLKHFVLAAPLVDSILVSGHLTLRWYLESDLYRFQDSLFATIRHPHDIALSQVNHALERMLADPLLEHPELASWGEALGLRTIDPEMEPAALRALGRRLLEMPGLVPTDPLCTYLGEGTADSAIELMTRCDIELVDVSQYGVWLTRRWGIDSRTRHRASPGVLRPGDLDSRLRALLEERCAEDMRLYERILAAIDRAQGGFVTGPELA